MESWLLESGDIVLRAVFAIIWLFLFTRILGAKQISQLTFFDYVIGISMGSIAAEMTVNRDQPYHYAVIAMAIFSLLALLISFLATKSMAARRFLVGKPMLLIKNGRLLEKNLKRSKLDINEFLAQCRLQGYFNLADIEFALMEANGQISFLPKEEKRGVVCEDMGLSPEQEGLVANVVIDGKVMKRNLKAAGKDESWLKKALAQQKAGNISEILLATVDIQGSLSVYHKNDGQSADTMLD